MAKVVPFAGWRYNLKKISNPAEVIVPPYDVISPRQLSELREKNPFNFSKIILPEGENKHSRAAELLKTWQREKILVQDSGPKFYFYKQTFKLKPYELFCQNIDRSLLPSDRTLTRTGILCRVHVEDYEAKIILPHEKTFAGPKADRYLLMEAAQGNMEPVFLGYDSPRFSGDEFDSVVGTADANVKYSDWEGVGHELWAVGEDKIHKEVQKFLEPLKFYILDGHHRYETALKFYNDHRKNGRPSMGFALANICAFKQTGTVILPTHRVLKDLGLLKGAALEKKLLARYSITKNLDLAQAEEAMMSTTQPAFALKQKESGYWAIIYKGNRGGRLDLEVLHSELLNELSSGQSLEGSEPGAAHIDYIKDIKELEDRIARGEFDLGILVKPCTTDEVMTVAGQGKVMPHKSTFFYPKIPSGLVVNLFE